MSTPERIPLRRVIVQIATWSAPGYQLPDPDGRIIFAPKAGGIQADTLETIRKTYPHATIVVVEESAPDGH